MKYEYRSRMMIEATKFDVANAHKMTLPEGVIVIESPSHADNYNYIGFKFAFQSENGKQPIKNGDYIVTGGFGGRYVYDGSTFDKTFEPAR